WKTGADYNVAEATSHIQIGYYYFVAGIYYLFGHHEIIVDIFNIFFGIFAAILLYYLTRELFSESAAKIAAGLAMFWPSIMLWSTRNLKDALLLFLMAGMALAFVKLIKKFQFGFLAISIISAVLLLSMRAYTFFIFAGSLGLGYLFLGFKRFDKKTILAGISVTVLLVLAVIFLAQFKNLQWNYLAKINLDTLDTIRKSTIFGGSSFGQNVEYRTWADVIKFLPVGLTYSVFSPFPWQTGSGLFKIAIPETILWYLALIFVIWGIIIAWRKKKYEAWGLILFLILITVSFAVFQGNIGSLFRQRAQIWFFGFVFAGAGLVGLFNSKSECLKRIFDIAASLFGLILFSPLFLITSLAILFEDGWPV
ncbi:MAG: glycosyltransferase family 39 protein, partial [bacterium]|nr:glycosyltransferase family 39 protein [bacterium]